MPVLAVFGLAVIEIWAAVPAGLALGLPAGLIWVATVAGSLAGVSLVLYGGSPVRDRLVRRLGPAISARTGRLTRVWHRYGVVGWGLISPLVMAPAMGAALGLLLGAPRGRLLASMGAGIALWSTILMIAGLAGLDLLHRSQ